MVCIAVTFNIQFPDMHFIIDYNLYKIVILASFPSSI